MYFFISDLGLNPKSCLYFQKFAVAAQLLDTKMDKQKFADPALTKLTKFNFSSQAYRLIKDNSSTEIC